MSLLSPAARTIPSARTVRWDANDDDNAYSIKLKAISVEWYLALVREEMATTAMINAFATFFDFPYKLIIFDMLGLSCLPFRMIFTRQIRHNLNFIIYVWTFVSIISSQIKTVWQKKTKNHLAWIYNFAEDIMKLFLHYFKRCQLLEFVKKNTLANRCCCENFV